MGADRALDPDGQHPDWSQLLAARWALRAGTCYGGAAPRGLGAAVVGEHDMPGLVWTVLADPEGNEFCIGEHTDETAGGK